ncbi:MAG: NUDIX domain-containing protein [Candidatus Paceibacterota bacterium]
MEENIPKNYPYFFNISLKLILENEKGKILGLKCINEGTLAGFYDLPGGRINSDELQVPYEKIIAREMAEEVGSELKYEIDLHPLSTGKFVYFSQKLGRENCIFMILFKAKYLGGDVHISEEHSDYKWLDLNSENASEYFTLGFLDGINGYLKDR